MCKSGNGQKLEWFKGYPQVEGDFLWVSQWSGCGCVRKSGIAYVYEADEEAEPANRNPIEYRNAEGVLMTLSWEGQPPYFFDDDPKKPDVHQFAAIEIPDPIEIDEYPTYA